MGKTAIQWNERAGVVAAARTVLPRLAADYFREVRDFLAEEHPPEDLHRMRLAAKRLRYTLELFRPCYGPGMAHRMSALKELQDALGALNDAVATRRLLGNSVNRKVRNFLDQLAVEKAAAFRRHWQDTFDAPGKEAWWTGYLRRNARRPSAGVKPPDVTGARNPVRPSRKRVFSRHET